MIPIKLALRNFMCYRDNIPPISFESIHIACISGNNGNGKSALVDAITWALWGQTRANSDDELVHAGQSEAEVEFEFAIGQQRYRIIRKHSRPKTQKGSGQTILEFQAASADGYKVLSGDTATQTQQKITQVLRMDYETFINSAFIRQGHSDEFTKKRPSERKQVLGNILQLSVYDELEAQAREQAKEQENLKTQLEAAIGGIQEELALKPNYLFEYEKAQNELSEVEKLTKEQESRLASLRKDQQALENKKNLLAELAGHIEDTQRNLNLWNEQVLQCQARIKEFEELISRRAIIDKHYQQFVETRILVQELDQKFKQVNALTQNKHRLEIIMVKANEELNRSHAVIENRIHELEAVSQGLPQLQEDMQQTVNLLRSLEEDDTRLQEKRENSKLLHARVHFLQAEKIRLLQEKNQIDEKLKMLTGQGGVTCPLCETELGADGQKRIENKFRSEKDAKNNSFKASESELDQKEAEVRALEADIIQSEAKLKRAKEVAQAKYGNLNKAISDALDAAEKIKAEKKLLEEIEQKLAGLDFAAKERTALKQIEDELANIGYDSQYHEKLRCQLVELEQYESPRRKLDEADRLISQEKETEKKACRTADELRLKMENDARRRQSLLGELDAFNRVAGDLTLAESEYQRLLSEQKQLQEVMGGAKAKLERLADLGLKNKEKESQLSQTAKQEKIFKDLAQAFGKKGIQAMLIELAIPEIEAEANKLLARMTDNRMHIKIETQRETRKGDVMETLDINISDELGTRNYEMFSGGEAFRIDFAIRVALSKLLARRAGAPLPTLIIDEGFGTQDSSGIEKIKEAITSIQDDFEKILVITHITEFKDSFPVRIEVVKTPEGSTIFLN